MTFLPQEVIRAKRDGGHLSEDDIQQFVRGLTDGSVGDGQAAAFAMAVFFRGMELDERVALTRAMAVSGTNMAWRRGELKGPILDKHSTGGVGDKISLMLAPLVAACGGSVPMISGRGLGHTGGTLDKLESIPGYRAKPDNDLFHRVVAEVGCAVIGQTDDLAPADRRLYAIRDVTATVESIALITASILSKKLAADLDALTMDVKFGNGAFMREQDDAAALARSIVEVATGAGLPTVALLTDMNQVLGRTAGNAIEVKDAIDWLTGAAEDARTSEVTYALGAEMLLLGGLAPSLEAARERLVAARHTGDAADRFQRMVTALGGPPDLVLRPADHLPSAPVTVAASSSRAGFVTSVDTRAVGLAVVTLGGGRTRVEDGVDHSVGLTEIAAQGEEVGPDRPLAIVHARTRDQADRACAQLRAAFTVGDLGGVAGPVVAGADHGVTVAAVLRRPTAAASGPLALEARPLPLPAPGEVLVAVEACAVCRTDLQLCEGDLPAHALPIVPGHQIVGRVVAIGDGVAIRLVGDRVGIAWIAAACGACDACGRGQENLCDAATFTGWDRDGGFAEHVTARADFTFPLDDGAAASALAPLLCGGAIGLRALRLAGVEPGCRVGLFGFGASATCAIQIARHWGCDVFVATRSAREQARARTLGAEWAGGYDDPIPHELDAAVTFAPSGDVVVAALRAVRKAGTVAINAIHLDRIPEFPYGLLWGERVLRSVANVTRADVAELLRLAVQIPIVTEYEAHPLADVNEVLARLSRGAVRGAAVLV